MKWGSHIVDTPTLQTATVNEMDYSQIFDNINFMLSPALVGSFPSESMSEKCYPVNAL